MQVQAVEETPVRRERESGMALIETVLVLPLLLLVLFGICELGLAFARARHTHMVDDQFQTGMVFGDVAENR